MLDSPRQQLKREFFWGGGAGHGPAHIHQDLDSHHKKPSKPSKSLWFELMKKYDWFKSDSLMAAIVSS